MVAHVGRQLFRLQRQLASVKLLIIDEWPPRQAAPCPSDTGNDAGAVAAVATAQRQHRHVRLADPGRLKLRRNVTTSSTG